MTRKTVKKLLAVSMILTVSMFTAGCDDDDDNDRKRPHKHAHNDHRDYRNHDRDRDSHKNQHRDDHKNTNQRDDKRPHKPKPHHRSNMVGEYSAVAINNAVTPKGTTVYVDIFEDDNDDLYLELPNGSSYPISFDGNSGEVAGGAISKSAYSAKTDGSFVYKDKKGGMWLVEKID
ncbi:MAG: hypothetical protein IKN12_10570 [Selenomonadaceae bacterium]|nr:hypothetical protein [Selenomonadaceae bacterium]